MNERTKQILERYVSVEWHDPSSAVTPDLVGGVSLMQLSCSARAAVAFAMRTIQRRGGTAYLSIAVSGLPLWRDTAVWLAATFSQSRVIVHIHSGCMEFAKGATPGAWIRRRAMERSEMWVYDVRFAKTLRTAGARSIELIDNGVTCEVCGPTKTVRERQNEKPQVIFLSNCVNGKGVDTFVDLVRPHLSANQVQAIIAGHPRDPRYERIASQLVRDFPWDVQRIRQVDEVTRCTLLRSADILLFPTRYPLEGQPVVVCEAMQHGVVPVVTDQGGLPNQVGQGGVVCRTVQEMEAGLRELVSQPALLAERREAAAQWWHERLSAECYGATVSRAFCAPVPLRVPLGRKGSGRSAPAEGER